MISRRELLLAGIAAGLTLPQAVEAVLRLAPVKFFGNPAAGLNGLSTAGLHSVHFAGVGMYQDTAGTTPAVADGDPIGLWKDQAGTAHLYQDSSSLRPILKLSQVNGLPSVRFNGTSQFLKTSSLVIAPAFTRYAVLSCPLASSGNENAYMCGGNGSLETRLLSSKQDMVNAFVKEIGAGLTTVSNSTWTQVNSSWDGTSVGVFRTARSSDNTVTTATSPVSPYNYVGSRQGTSPSYYDGDIAMIAQYGYVQSTIERQANEAALFALYGV